MNKLFRTWSCEVGMSIMKWFIQVSEPTQDCGRWSQPLLFTVHNIQYSTVIHSTKRKQYITTLNFWLSTVLCGTGTNQILNHNHKIKYKKNNGRIWTRPPVKHETSSKNSLHLKYKSYITVSFKTAYSLESFSVKW